MERPARGAPGHWSAAGVFVFPPRSAWRRVSTATVSAGWRGLRGRPRVRDPLGLYVHVPAELDALKEYFILQRRHPFLEALEREAEALDLPAGLPLRTLYIGGAGAGALSLLEADEIAELLAWLRRRFGLEVEQAAVEVDASRLDAAKAAALARGGVDRVVALFPPDRGGAAWGGSPRGRASRPPSGSAWAGRDAVARARRSAFYDGLAACRAAGIEHCCVDIAVDAGGVQPAETRREADRAMALGADSVLVSGASATARGVAAGRPDAADGNLQLQHSWIYNASILGLGWGAVSHVRSRLVYGPAGDCFSHVRALLRGRRPVYEGARLSVDLERRAHIIRSLEDTGRVDEEAFRQAFGRRPEKVYPRLFDLLRSEGGLVESEGGYRVADDREPARRACAARFIDGRLLAALSRRGPAGRS